MADKYNLRVGLGLFPIDREPPNLLLLDVLLVRIQAVQPGQVTKDLSPAMVFSRLLSSVVTQPEQLRPLSDVCEIS
jgi:hypothetical protein